MIQNKLPLELNKLIRKSNLSKKIAMIKERSIVLSDGRKLESGDIIYRPLKKLKSDKGLDLNHYAIVFGTNNKDEQLLLEMNEKNNVSFVTIESFMGEFMVNDIRWEKKPATTAFESIIKRAELLQFEIYNALKMNCRHFVNFCVYNKLESKAVQNYVNIVSPIFEFLILYYEGREKILAKPSDKKLINSLNNLIKEEYKKIKKLK